MSNLSRREIFTSLSLALEECSVTSKAPEKVIRKNWSLKERIVQLKDHLESVRGEVHISDENNWMKTLKSVLMERKNSSLLYSPCTPIGEEIANSWKPDSVQLPNLVEFKTDIESFKENLFKIDASVTTAWGAIAENGSIILWPDKNEPRSMSLVPPVHIVILKATKIYNTFSEALQHKDWINNTPTNAVLISGPSKTADIELVLAFGVHGPKELITIII